MERKFAELLKITLRLLGVIERLAEDDLTQALTDELEMLRTEVDRLVSLLRDAKDYHEIAQLDIVFLQSLFEEMSESSLTKVMKQMSVTTRNQFLATAIKAYDKAFVGRGADDSNDQSN